MAVTARGRYCSRPLLKKVKNGLKIKINPFTLQIPSIGYREREEGAREYREKGEGGRALHRCPTYAPLESERFSFSTSALKGYSASKKLV